MATIELTHVQYYNEILTRLRELEADTAEAVQLDIQLLRYIEMAIRRAVLVRDNPTKEKTQ